MITLSLLIATYNRCRARLIDTLESVVGQDAPGREQWECVVSEQQLEPTTRLRASPPLRPRTRSSTCVMVEGAQSGPVVCAQPRHTREYGRIYSHHRRRRTYRPDPSSSAYITLFDTVPEAVAGGGPIVPVYPSGTSGVWMSCFHGATHSQYDVSGRPHTRVPRWGISPAAEIWPYAAAPSSVTGYSTSRSGVWARRSREGEEESDLFERPASGRG